MDVNSRNSDGETLLHIACLDGCLEFVDILISAGADINAIDQNRNTPLDFAIFRGHAGIVRYLLSFPDILVNKLDLNGESPLHYCIERNDLEIVRLLVSHPGIDVNIHNPESPWRPIHYVIPIEDIRIAETLLSHPNIDVNVQNSNGDTPLHLVVSGEEPIDDYVEFVALCILKGANLSIRNKKGWLPLCNFDDESARECAKILFNRCVSDIPVAACVMRIGFDTGVRQLILRKLSSISS